MGKSREYYKRNLPHYQPDDYTFFITFRLYGTLPAEAVENFKKIKRKRLEIISGHINTRVRSEKYEEFKWEYFEMFDDYINNCNSGVHWLKQKEVADIVKKAIHYRDKKEYDLIVYTIMPNHVHMVFTPIVERDLSRSQELADCSERSDSDINVDLHSRNKTSSALQFPVTNILRKLKGSTSRACNLILHRTGPFWQHESYDHVIRNADELRRIVEYVLNNPVKAGLADTPEEWEYNYVNYELIPVL